MSNTVNKVEDKSVEAKVESLDKKLKSDNIESEFLSNKKMTVEEAAKEELDSLVYMDNVKKILEIAFKTEENVILYGPGGYGKSESSLAFLKSLGIEPFIMTLGSGTTVDRLFGGVDIPTFNETGKLEYLVENSFMNHEYVIFEELFDAPDYILEPLKDILSSGVFRNGNQAFPIKTKLIICCTNKERQEFSKNNSLKALMERFPLETKVIWKDHTRITYENLLNKKIGFSDPMLTYILEQFAVAGTIISPRIAIKAARIINKMGPEALVYIADFNGKAELLKTTISKFESFKKVTDNIKNLADMTLKYQKLDKGTLQGVQEGSKINNAILAAINQLKAIKADDSLAEPQAKALKTYTEIHAKNKKELDIILVMDDNIETAIPQEETSSENNSTINPF